MREIKFRGKRYNGDWVFGDLCVPANRFVSIRGNKYNYNGISHEESEVDEETIGQYTGLKDKNKTEIYEGDILQIREYINKAISVFEYNEISCFSLEEIKGNLIKEWKGSVKYEESCFYVGDAYLSGFHGDMRFSFPIYEIEVIGNIHDNPKLLELK